MKKSDLNKAKVAVLGYSAAVALISMASAQVEAADCTKGSTTGGVTCSITVGTYGVLASDVKFTGSNEVDIRSTGDTTGFGACGGHLRGTSSYGSTLSGGSGTVKTGTVASPQTGAAATVTGGC